MKLQNKKYNIIYADPPWPYNSNRLPYNKNNGGEAKKHYKAMTIDQIKNLDVGSIADKDCTLFLWATFPNIQLALDTISAWKFKYKTLGFSWIKTDKLGKPSFGVGSYTRSNCEVCLLAVKGKPKTINHSISSVIISPREQHSKKPDVIRSKIIQLYGNIPRIELFARAKSVGWDSWGDEI